MGLPAAVAAGSTVELGVFLAIGLFGGAHCIGMCGPLVTRYARSMGDDGSDGQGPTLFELRQHALFNLGRTLSYAVLGGLFGLLGRLVFSATAVVHVSRLIRGVAGLLAGVFILSVGLYRVVGRAGSVLSLLPGTLGVRSAFARVSSLLTRRIDGLASNPGILGLGALHGLLPCPLLYPAFLYAFTRGVPVRGALDLAALGIGTVPAVFLFGTAIGSVDTTRRVRLHRALGVVFLVLGYLPLAMGLHAFGVDVPMLVPPFYQPLG